MKTYEKIETLYQRDIEGTKKLMPGVYRNPTMEFLKDNTWEWTEKVEELLPERYVRVEITEQDGVRVLNANIIGE